MVISHVENVVYLNGAVDNCEEKSFGFSTRLLISKQILQQPSQ